MKITINDSRKIFAVQQEFSKMYPCLKLEFFAKPSGPGGKPSKKEITHPSKTLGEVRAVHTSGLLTVTPGTTVAELEQNLRDNFDLAVQIFRKSGKAWIETVSTDGWSLERENKLGEEMEKPETEATHLANPGVTEER
jgi:hypothetical protein